MASAAPSRASIRQLVPVVGASTVGTAIEWYDYFTYGTMASLVFPKLFFPTSDPFVSTMLSLSTFLVGFIARPFGGALFGHFGDRLGRKGTLVSTLLLMGISTFLIGLLPDYNTIGIAAPLILTVLRICQGLGVGGEWGGSVLLSLEYAHNRRRGFWSSWAQMGVPVGLIASSQVINLFQNPTFGAQPGFFNSIGWRIPFLLSALLIGVGLWVRLGILETPLFAKVKEENKDTKAPILDAFRHDTPAILLSAGARFIEQAPFYIFTTFVVTYAAGPKSTLKLDSSVILTGITYAGLIELLTIPLFSFLSDIVGRRIWYLIGCVIGAAFLIPLNPYGYFPLLNTKDPQTVTLGIILSLALAHAWVYGPQAALISERFRTRSRYSAASLGYQLAAPFAGGLAPLIAVALLAGHGTLGALGLSTVKFDLPFPGAWENIGWYGVVLAVISFVAVLGLRDYTHADIAQDVPAPVPVGVAQD